MSAAFRASPVLVLLACTAAAKEIPPTPPVDITSIDQAMLFRSFVQDDPSCSVSVVGGEVQLPSPATCPDAFAWAQFAGAIQGEFWNWGLDTTVWPATPYPLCTDSLTEDCCPADFPTSPTADLLAHCSYQRDALSPVPPLSALTSPLLPASAPSGVSLDHRGFQQQTNVEQEDPGRLLRDLQVEIVFRNAAMVDYVFTENLYNKEGLGGRVRAANAAVTAGDIQGAHDLAVQLPPEAIMVKADFIHQDIMAAQGLIEDTDRDRATPPNNPDHPYLTIYLEGDEDTAGFYYLVSMTNASKALPAWHWYAMEHVANRGRCDYIGCNDSFGYTVSPGQGNGAIFGDHFIPPKQQLENNQEITGGTNPNDAVFLTGTLYDPAQTGETITTQLATLLDAVGVGTDAVDADPGAISAADPQWRSYRLKGTQSTFTTTHGVPTGTGSTVTEGGFVNSSSCLTCHAQASVDEDGNPGAASVGATWRPNLFGFQQVEMGAPDLSWFFSPGTATPYDALQIDFMWGILGAKCIEADPNDASTCKTYPAP